FIAELHHRRPDVIEKLDFDDGFEPASCHTYRTSNDVGLSQWGVEHAVGAELTLQTRSQLEHTTLSLDQFLGKILFAAAVGDVFSEDDDPLVTPHLVFQTRVDQIGHRFRGWSLLGFAIGGSNYRCYRELSFKRRRGRIQVRRVNKSCNRFLNRGRRFQSPIACFLNFMLNFLMKEVDSVLVEDSLSNQEPVHAGKRIALCVSLTFLFWPVEAFVIRE